MNIGPRAGLPRADIHDVIVGIVGHAIPDSRAAADFPPLVGPGFGGSRQFGMLKGLGWIARNRVEAPGHFPGIHIVG